MIISLGKFRIRKTIQITNPERFLTKMIPKTLEKYQTKKVMINQEINLIKKMIQKIIMMMANYLVK